MGAWAAYSRMLVPIRLAHNRSFVRLWAGQTISEIGSRITREGLPLTAALVLAATPAQMGILSAAGAASVLLFSLFAGVIVDRVRKRPVMIAADVGRALLLGAIPVLALSHLLSISALIVVGATAGVLTVLFDVAYQSYLPVLVAREDLLEGNRLLSIASSTAELIGPAVTGLLVQIITAPLAILLDAVSFLISALSIWSIRIPEPEPLSASGPSGLFPSLEEMAQGFKTILAHPVLRALFYRSITAFLSMGALFSFYILYAIRVLKFSPVELGFAIALGGAGSLVGGFFAGRLARLIPLKLSFLISAVVIVAFQSLVPAASLFPRWGAAFLCIQQFFGDCAWTVYYVGETTLRQQVAPGHLLGRVNAAMQFASRGMLPIGALASGFLGNSIGIVPVLWIGWIGLSLSTFWLAPLLWLNDPEPSMAGDTE